MILEIASKEIRENITSPKVIITYFVCLVLILAAILSGASNYLALKEETTRMEAAEIDRLRNIFSFQDDFLQKGVYLFREPNPLSVLVSGVEGDSARRANINIYVTGFDVSQFNNKPILALFGMLDLEFIVKMILSLFAILFTFDSISGEREKGTLKLNLANEVSRANFIIGKFIGNFVLILIPFVIPLLMGLLILMFIPGVSFGGEEWARIAMLVLGFVLYLIVFYSLGIMVSSLTRNPSTSFLILLMIWVVVIAIIPRGAVLIAQSMEPVPPVDEIRKDVIADMGPTTRDFQKSIQDEAAKYRQQAQAIKAPPKPPVGKPEDNPDYMRALEAYQQKIQAIQDEFSAYMADQFDKVYGKMREDAQKKIRVVDNMQKNQTQLAVTISRLASPAAALSFLSNRMAATGVYSSDRTFQENIQSLEAGFLQRTNQFLQENPNLLNWSMQQSEVLDMSKYYPNLNETTGESFATSLEAVLIDYATLALLSIVFIAVAFTAFLRYDVR